MVVVVRNRECQLLQSILSARWGLVVSSVVPSHRLPALGSMQHHRPHHTICAMARSLLLCIPSAQEHLPTAHSTCLLNLTPSNGLGQIHLPE